MRIVKVIFQPLNNNTAKATAHVVGENGEIGQVTKTIGNKELKYLVNNIFKEGDK